MSETHDDDQELRDLCARIERGPEPELSPEQKKEQASSLCREFGMTPAQAAEAAKALDEAVLAAIRNGDWSSSIVSMHDEGMSDREIFEHIKHLTILEEIEIAIAEHDKEE